MNFMEVLMRMLQLFIVILIGYLAVKIKLLSPSSKDGITAIVLNVGMPALILSSAFSDSGSADFRSLAFVLLIAFLCYGIWTVVAVTLPKLCKLNKEEQGLAAFGMVFSNVAFIGYPVTRAIFGSAGVIYTMIFNIPWDFLCFSLGIRLLCGKGEKGDKNPWLETVKAPSFLASIVALVVLGFGIQVPPFLCDTLTMVGNLTSPCSLVLIGVSLASIPLKEIFDDVRIYALSVIKLLICPLIVFVLLKWWIVDSMLFGTAVILSSMPVAATGTMIAIRYGKDDRFMAKYTFLTILFSLAAIPLVAAFIL